MASENVSSYVRKYKKKIGWAQFLQFILICKNAHMHDEINAILTLFRKYLLIESRADDRNEETAAIMMRKMPQSAGMRG